VSDKLFNKNLKNILKMSHGYSFSTQDKLKKYCKDNENIDLTLIDESENINVDHIKVLEMINFCFLGDYQNTIKIVTIMHDILFTSNYFGERQLAVKVLYYRFRGLFIARRIFSRDLNIETMPAEIHFFNSALHSFSNIESSSELRFGMESSWIFDKYGSLMMMKYCDKNQPVEKNTDKK